MVYYNHTAKIGGDLFLDWTMGWRGSTLNGHQKPASLISSRSRESMISMDGPGALRNNGHPSRGQNGRLNGAQTGGGGILRNVQAHFPSRSHSAGVAAAAVGVARPQ